MIFLCMNFNYIKISYCKLYDVNKTTYLFAILLLLDVLMSDRLRLEIRQRMTDTYSVLLRQVALGVLLLHVPSHPH